MKNSNLIKRPIQDVSNYIKVIDELLKKVEELERRIVQLEETNLEIDAYGNKILKQGIEYISKVIGGEVVSEYSWQDADWVKYKIQLDGVTGDWEINIRKPSRQLQIGTSIRHYIIGRKIQNFKIISDE
jgi:hypothetical protein